MMRHGIAPARVLCLLVLGLAVLGLAGLKYVLAPQIESQRAKQAQLADLQSGLQAAQAALAARQQEKDADSGAAEQWQEVKAPFDYVVDDGLALVYISVKAAEAPVEIIAVTPAAVVDRGTHLEHPVEIEIRGGYLEVRAFIRQLENAPLLTEIRTLTISGLEAREAAGPAETAREMPEARPPAQNGKVTATCCLVTYSSPAPSAAVPVEELVAEWALGRDNAFQTPRQ